MKSKSTAAYNAIFEWLKTQIPNFRPEVVMSDFESALREAIRENFPLARHLGCWFHFCWAIYRKMCNLGLSAAYQSDSWVRKVGNWFMAIPLLPPEHIIAGRNFVDTQIRGSECYQQQLLQVVEYFDSFSYWVMQVGVESLSVFNQPRRTNGIQESWHRTLNRRAGQNPNFWKFAEAIREDGNFMISQLARSQEGFPLSRGEGHPNRWLRQNIQISTLSTNWVLKIQLNAVK
uniref:Lysine-specific demethylase 3A n=1 Tax=Lygus hesperus TaxID=30085 RepID=A0A0A9YHQ0_LYGHE